MFLLDSDFNAFNINYATSTDPNIIKNREYVINRFKYLYDNQGNIEGLGKFFASKELFPHPEYERKHTNLTNIIWPFFAANGNHVDYLRMGFGKPGNLVKELAKRSKAFTQITNYGEYDSMAFYCVTQLQIGLNENFWWINIYIDKQGWLETNNLLAKLNYSNNLKQEFIDLLTSIVNEHYQLNIYINSSLCKSYNNTDPFEFINKLNLLKSKNASFSISIEKIHTKNSVENSKSTILNYLKDEFEKLLPLYNFISWHPQNNNYLGI